MGVGDLIRNTRASLGIPKGTMGLITNKYKEPRGDWYIYEIQWVGRDAYGRRLERDLEVIG
jgi:hypothetical protein